MVATTESSDAFFESAESAKTPAAEAAGLAAGRAVSARKRRANRRNAQKSTGPRTPQGKARSARNSTSHRIFCRDLLLEGEDPEMFRMTRESFLRALKPQDAVQLAMVDGAMAARWRLNRCQRAESRMIEQRTRRPKQDDGIAARIAKLESDLRFCDFGDAALAAKCARDKRYRQCYQEWCALRERTRAGRDPGGALVQLLEEQPLERLGRYANRLEYSFHRCLRDLHVLKQRAKEYADEPESPFLGATVPGDDAQDDTPNADDGADRGLGLPPEHSSAANPSAAEEEEEEEEEELGRDAQATQATVQNEPTAGEPVASVGPAEGSGAGAGADAPPDPQEMAELRKITDRLARCRPSEIGDDDDDAYDE